jgi:hypothetical protein
MLARVAPTNGYYAVYSGEVTPLPADLFDGGDRWLEVEVGAPLAPRQYIGSVAHAITCKNVSGGAVNAVNIQLNGKPVVAGRPAGPNLLSNTLTFSHIPAGPSNITASGNWGAWRYYAYSAAKAEILVENPPAELLAIVQPGAQPWWPRAFKVLHLKFSAGGGEPGRLPQLAAASDKQGSVTMSAYVRVVGSGQLSMGQESSWKPLTNSTWQRVAVTDASPAAPSAGLWIRRPSRRLHRGVCRSAEGRAGRGRDPLPGSSPGRVARDGSALQRRELGRRPRRRENDFAAHDFGRKPDGVRIGLWLSLRCISDREGDSPGWHFHRSCKGLYE